MKLSCLSPASRTRVQGPWTIFPLRPFQLFIEKIKRFIPGEPDKTIVTTLAAIAALAVLIGSDLHVRNFRFLIEPPFATAPSVWGAFANSLYLAGTETVLVVAISSLAGYYLSRFKFPGRRMMFGALLALHAFPVVTLLIPLFLMAAYAGLIDRLIGVVFVLVAFELPFAIFIMKGFFDAVPWDIEMAAIVDGATFDPVRLGTL